MFYFVAERVCLDFVNTEIVDGDERVDLLTRFDDLLTWCVMARLLPLEQARGLATRWEGEREAERALVQAREFRAGLRAMCERLVDGKAHVAAQTIDEINALLRTPVAHVELTRTKQGYDNVFRILASDEDVGMAIASYTVKDLKAKNIAVIDDRTAYGQGAAEVFARGVKALGGNIVAQEYGSDKATDFMAILTTIKSKQPDVVFYGGMDAQGGLIARQMKQLGITAKLLGTDGLCTDEVAKISGGAVDGLLYCTRGGKEVEKTSRGAEFEQRYKARYGTEVLTYAPYLYDAMMALAEGMRAANSVEPQAYLPAMRKVKFDGVTGTISFDAKGNLQKPDFTVFTYKDGKRVRVAGS